VPKPLRMNDLYDLSRINGSRHALCHYQGAGDAPVQIGSLRTICIFLILKTTKNLASYGNGCGTRFVLIATHMAENKEQNGEVSENPIAKNSEHCGERFGWRHFWRH